MKKGGARMATFEMNGLQTLTRRDSAQVFGPGATSLARFALLCVVGGLGLLFVGLELYVRSPYVTNVGVPVDQPVPFSHKHHVGDDGIDCRYCHTTVETSAFAGMPPTQTCMNCHSQIWSGSPALEPVRESARTGIPLQWNRVTRLPGFVYFDHSIHIQKGVGCSSCHGQVDQMPLTMKTQTMQMGFCLDCHQHPEMNVRPRDQVLNMSWQPSPTQAHDGLQLMHDYGIESKVSCSVCHR